MASVPLSTIELQAHEALRLLVELISVEFKESQPFETLKYKITKAVMALANNRDGGLVIIGVSEREHIGFTLDGVDDAVAATYSHEELYRFVADYATPPPEIATFFTVYESKRYVVISVKPCERSPVICRRSSPDRGVSDKDRINICEIYVRAGAPIRTQRVNTASMLDDLLQAAAGRRAAEMIRTLWEAGAFEGMPGLTNRFDRETSDVADLI
jgi:predicted HTH transcriptional regulator